MYHKCALNGDGAFVDDIWSNVDRLAEAKEDVVLNLSGVEFMDSLGAGAVASLNRRLGFKGLQLKIIGLHGQPLRLLLELHLVPVSGTASDRFRA